MCFGFFEATGRQGYIYIETSFNPLLISFVKIFGIFVSCNLSGVFLAPNIASSLSIILNLVYSNFGCVLCNCFHMTVLRFQIVLSNVLISARFNCMMLGLNHQFKFLVELVSDMVLEASMIKGHGLNLNNS